MTPKYPIGTWVVEHATATVCQVVAVEAAAAIELQCEIKAAIASPPSDTPPL